MSKLKPALLLFLALSLFVFVCPAHCTAPDYRTRPGMIKCALAMPDESSVYLDAVRIEKISADFRYFTIREFFSSTDRVIVASAPSPRLRLGQLVDIQGCVTTLANGNRAIDNVTVYGYTDQAGNLLRYGPLLKGIMAPTPWAWKTDLTVRSTPANPNPVVSVSPDEPNAAPRDGPDYYPRIGDIFVTEDAQSQTSGVQSLYEGIPDVLGLPDGSLVELQCKRITAVDVETINGTSYKYVDLAEDPPTQGAIRAYYSSGSIAVTSRINNITGQIRHVGANPVICVDDGPGYNPQLFEGSLRAPAQGTIPWAKTLADGAALSSPLQGQVVSRVFPSQGCFYIQEQSRMAGIRVASGTLPNVGAIVTTTGGTMSTVGGERVVNNPTSVQQTGTATVRPLGMSHKLVGGGRANQYTTGIGGGSGISNTGELARVFGKVKSVGSDCFYLEDGSNVNSVEGSQTGLKVSWAWHGQQDGDPQIVGPNVDWWVYADGISGAEGAAEPYTRTIRVREQGDLHLITPGDTTDPVITITMPPDGDIHKSTNETTVRIAGAAFDVGTVVTSVQVKVVAGHNAAIPARPWFNAAGTTNWYYDWNDVQTGNYTLWASATDFAGNVAEISRNVTVTNVDVIYVNSERPDNTGDGLTWTTAKKTVIAGMDSASAGKEVWVAVGTYIETATILLKSGVGLYGGFAGAETAREQRNWASNPTVLDGNNTRAAQIRHLMMDGLLWPAENRRNCRREPA